MKTKENKPDMEEIRRIRKIIVPVLKRNDVVKAGIFGSFARGEAKKGSDIDILIEFKGRKSLLDLVGVKQDLEEKTRRKVDVVEYSTIHPLLKNQILHEEVKVI